MTDKEWREGYADGYSNGWKAGYERGKTEGLPTPNPYQPPVNPNDWLRSTGVGTTCPVCGMFFEYGKTYGYCCGHSKCPTRITCQKKVFPV